MTDENTLDNYNELSKISIVDAALAQDKESFMKAFNDAIAVKVSDALEVKKVEIASNLLGQQEVEGSNEIQTVEAEVDGSGDANAVAAATEEPSAA